VGKIHQHLGSFLPKQGNSQGCRLAGKSGGSVAGGNRIDLTPPIPFGSAPNRGVEDSKRKMSSIGFRSSRSHPARSHRWQSLLVHGLRVCGKFDRSGAARADDGVGLIGRRVPSGLPSTLGLFSLILESGLLQLVGLTNYNYPQNHLHPSSGYFDASGCSTARDGMESP
jgi:hypothetical protein